LNLSRATYQCKRYHQRRKHYIDVLGGRCVRCGSTDRLEFDHIDHTTKTVELADAFATYSQQRLEAEVDKCQLLCKVCHVDKSIQDLGRVPGKGVHGTYRNYTLGCRCTECRAASAAHARKYYKPRTKEQRVVRASTLPCGDPEKYRHGGCRCTTCRTAQAAAVRQYRAKKKLGSMAQPG
jgi:hypothetical protein